MSQRVGRTEAHLAPIEYEPSLVEESVRWVIENGSPGVEPLKLQRLRFDHHRRLDTIYALPVGESREATFHAHFDQMFGELGIAAWIADWLALFPRLRTELDSVLVRATTTPGEEGAELWESREGRGEGAPAYLVIAVSSSGLIDADELRAGLLPDLLRAADLIDPAFGFRAADLTGPTRATRARLRALYQRLWELSTRARLQQRGLREDSQLLPALQRFLAAHGSHSGQTAAAAALDPPTLLTMLCACTHHAQLLAIASQLLQDGLVCATSGGVRCPLCRYPTTDWTSEGILVPLESAIRADFPSWAASDGCCGHCAERYELFATAH